MNKETLKSIHKLSIHQLSNKELQDEQLCGCFYCTSQFRGRDVVEFVDGGMTPLCPHCGIDSVIIASDLRNSLSITLTESLLEEMYEYAFT